MLTLFLVLFVIKLTHVCVGYLQEQLVFCDSLDWFDEEVTDRQPGLDVLLDSLEDKTPKASECLV